MPTVEAATVLTLSRLRPPFNRMPPALPAHLPAQRHASERQRFFDGASRHLID